MSVEYTIICDGCGFLGDGSRFNAATARTALKHQRAWLVNQPGGKDYCDDCRESPRTRPEVTR